MYANNVYADRVSSPATTAVHPDDLEAHRRALTGYCYRMLGCGSEAEDAVQETMVRAWRSVDSLQARAALKGWLFRIAGNVCLDMLGSAQRRATPMDMGPSSSADTPVGVPLAESVWVQPIASDRVIDPDADPATVLAARETLRLAFVAALQHLPARQRAVLVLCEALKFSAAEAAEALEMSVASVNSALQRARATLSSLDLEAAGPAAAAAEEAELLDGYIDAFEAYDIERLVTLLRDDVAFTMPPFSLWVQGPAAVAEFMRGQGAKCEGSQARAVRMNGGPAMAIYNPDGEGGYQPWAVVLFEMTGGVITSLHHSIGGADHFAALGVPVTP